MQNAELDESQAGIKIAWKNINNLRYADDVTLMTEIKEPKNLLIRVKEETEIAVLNFNIQKTNITASDPISSVQFSHSVMSYSATPWTAACRASQSITNSWSLLKLMSIELVMPSSSLLVSLL